MNIAELRTQSVEELNATLMTLHKEYFNLRMQHKGTQLDDTSSLRKIKKNIARVKTIITEKS